MGLSACILFPPPLVYLGVDPLEAMFPRKSTETYFLLHTVSTLARYTLLEILVIEIVKSTVALLLLGLLAVVGMVDLLKKLSKFRFYTHKVFKNFIEMKIWMEFVNTEFAYIAGPPLIFFGPLAAVFTNYGIVRHFSLFYINPILYCLLPFTSGLVLLFMTTLLPYGTDVYECSDSCLRRIRKRPASKFYRKKEKALRPFGAQIGPFGVAKRGLKVLVFRYLYEYSMNMLLTF